MESLKLLIDISEQKEKQRLKNLECARKYKDEHKDELKIKNKIYRENNKQEIKERYKNWFENNKDKIHEEANKKITCDCGLIVSNSYHRVHIKTKKHLETLLKLQKKIERENKLKEIYGE